MDRDFHFDCLPTTGMDILFLSVNPAAVLPGADVMTAAVKTAIEIAANSPSAVQAVKTQITAGMADYAASREALEQELGGRVRASLHFSEGVAAFREKRSPRYD